MMSESKKQDLILDAKNFCEGLTYDMMIKDSNSRHLLAAKYFIENLLSEYHKAVNNATGTSRGSRSVGGMGQLWVELDDLRRKNEELQKQLSKFSGYKLSIPHKLTQDSENVTIADYSKTKRENGALKVKVKCLETRIKEMNGVALNVQDEYKRVKNTMETDQKSMGNLLRANTQVENELKLTKKENESLKEKLTKTMLPIVQTDNCLVETLSERCRPSNIPQLYNTLESQEWVDAKEALEEITDFQEEGILQFLCACVMISFQSCMEVNDALSSKIAELLKNPILAIGNKLVGKQTGETKLPEDMADCIRNHLKQHFDDIDSGVIVGMMCGKLSLEFTNFVHCHENNQVQRFMNRCAKVTWQMVIQHPPMLLSVDDHEFDDEKHKLWWSCNHATANRIDFYVWPTLYDYKQGYVLIKGCVYTK